MTRYSHLPFSMFYMYFAPFYALDCLLVSLQPNGGNLALICTCTYKLCP